ncbi:ribonuclease P protein subunit p40-like isoform X2 [Episyrphus balteatus]|uniref:ribonuclease P protein subunit p40-like isoform X2 n=1 Tax=Episyrphus balteatus TaxID=286459 RepID=UPI002484FA86|nr:ribonuclease P protein subunit p40-like isoform X2 [Episyrphus balteatus]
MLCPEVWKFNANKNNTLYQTGNYDSKGKKALDKTLQNKFFNRMVSIILPECESIPEPIQQLIKTADYYLVRNLRLCELVRKDFVEAFIKRGRLTGILLQSGIFSESENKVYVTPDGKLNIVICKDLYQSLGLEGRPIGHTKERFEITIDLKNNNFVEQPKLHNRIKNALSNSEIERFDFQLTWESIDSSICPSSIAKFFKDIGYNVEQHSIQTQLAQKYNLKIPNEAFSKSDSKIAYQVAEYFGFIMLECDMNSAEELNSYCPSFNLNFDGQQTMGCIILHCKGLMSSDFVSNLFDALRLSSDVSKSVIFNINGEQFPTKRNTEQTFVWLKDNKYLFFTT